MKNSSNTSQHDDKFVIISSVKDFQQKVKFSDKIVSNKVSLLLKVLDFATYHCNASIVTLLNFLWAACIEIAIQYSPDLNLFSYSCGDLVVCNFGTHVDGEISGRYVYSIICDIQDDGMVFLLPITKRLLKGDDHKYMLVTSDDLAYFSSTFKPGTVLLKMGKYVRPERISKRLGRTSPEFFRKLLKAFHHSMNFLDNAPALTENTCKPQHKKKPSFEEYMQNRLAPLFESLRSDEGLSIEDKAFYTVKELGFEDNFGFIHDAFVVSCEVPRIAFPSILAALCKIHRTVDKEFIKTTLITQYDQWLHKQPDILQAYPNSSIRTLLKVFAQETK